jgi:hypothetical protein
MLRTNILIGLMSMVIICITGAVLSYGCEGAYPKENDLIKKAYNDGLEYIP